MQMVTGPSFSNSTCMSAPNWPVLTGLPKAMLNSLQNCSYSGMEISGRAARIYDGRLPFLVEACRVNWLTTRMSPLVSRMERFITPFSSSKMRRWTILRHSQSMSSAPSVSSMPTSISIPGPMDDFTRPPMLTEACLVRCITILISFFSYLFSRQRYESFPLFPPYFVCFRRIYLPLAGDISAAGGRCISRYRAIYAPVRLLGRL